MDVLDPGDHPHPVIPPALHRADITLKGAVGRALSDHGMQVTLHLLDQDTDFFDAFAAIQVSNQAHPTRGTVRITDDGDLSWQCHPHLPIRGRLLN